MSGTDVVGVSQAIEPDPNCKNCQMLSARLDDVERLVEKLTVVIEKQGSEIERLKARRGT